jgi:hypothetical protein
MKKAATSADGARRGETPRSARRMLAADFVRYAESKTTFRRPVHRARRETAVLRGHVERSTPRPYSTNSTNTPPVVSG